MATDDKNLDWKRESSALSGETNEPTPQHAPRVYTRLIEVEPVRELAQRLAHVRRSVSYPVGVTKDEWEYATGLDWKTLKTFFTVTKATNHTVYTLLRTIYRDEAEFEALRKRINCLYRNFPGNAKNSFESTDNDNKYRAFLIPAKSLPEKTRSYLSKPGEPINARTMKSAWESWRKKFLVASCDIVTLEFVDSTRQQTELVKNKVASDGWKIIQGKVASKWNSNWVAGKIIVKLEKRAPRALPGIAGGPLELDDPDPSPAPPPEAASTGISEGPDVLGKLARNPVVWLGSVVAVALVLLYLAGMNGLGFSSTNIDDSAMIFAVPTSDLSSLDQGVWNGEAAKTPPKGSLCEPMKGDYDTIWYPGDNVVKVVRAPTYSHPATPASWSEWVYGVQDTNGKIAKIPMDKICHFELYAPPGDFAFADALLSTERGAAVEMSCLRRAKFVDNAWHHGAQGTHPAYQIPAGTLVAGLALSSLHQGHAVIQFSTPCAKLQEIEECTLTGAIDEHCRSVDPLPTAGKYRWHACSNGMHAAFSGRQRPREYSSFKCIYVYANGK